MESKRKVINTGVRLSKEQFTKLNRLAESLSISRNAAVGLLIETAEVRQSSALVGANKNTQSAQVLPDRALSAV